MKNILVLAVLLLVVPASLNAQEIARSNIASSIVEAALVSLTNAWTEAINAKNRSKLEELMAPDFALHAWDDSWSVARADWLENLFVQIDIAEYHHSAIVAHVYGDVAAITSKWYWRGKRGTTAEKKPFEEHGYVLDVWRRNAGRWQVVSRITVVLPGKEEAGS
jgi:ketosteroid isomerase-like protein